jgi:PAS domain S-box-containing protein
VSAKIDPVLSNSTFDSLNDGLYVCDRKRKILFWSKSAERITGWRAEQVVGRRCKDNVLDHVDQDGRSLCGEETCPLNRSMCTGKGSRTSILIFGKTNSGERIPMTVSVAPVLDASGQVIGGVETFRDFSQTNAELMRAKRIQQLSMPWDLPQDSRVNFTRIYLPHDVIGGDYCAVQQLDQDRYGFLLADVMGHGVAAALYTMHLSSLWSRYHSLLQAPLVFARQINADLCKIVRDESFASAICGVLDAAQRKLRIVSAGGPPMTIFQPDGSIRELAGSGCPFGMVETAEYLEIEVTCSAQERLLLFTDGAVEIHNARERMLGSAGLFKILRRLGYPQRDLLSESLHEALLLYSNEICLNDDLTLLDIRFT